MTRLKDKVALITGATGGIGEATAEKFLSEGARLMLVGRSTQKLEALKEKLDGGKSVAVFTADATDEEALDLACKTAIEHYGKLDIVFANAGTEGQAGPLEDQTRQNFEDILNTNVIGVWLTIKPCIKHMKANKCGSIIVTSSAAGVRGVAGLGPYNASKHAVCGLVKTASAELGEFNVRVNAIAPGPIDNRMIHSLETQVDPSDPGSVRAIIEAAAPMGRYGTNDEVANLALFLASDESTYCTGGIFPADGGRTAV